MIEHVHRVTDVFDLCHFQLPSAKSFRRGRKNALPMILSLMKNNIQMKEDHEDRLADVFSLARSVGQRTSMNPSETHCHSVFGRFGDAQADRI